MTDYINYFLSSYGMKHFLISTVLFWVVWCAWRRKIVLPSLPEFMRHPHIRTDITYWFFNQWVTIPVYYALLTLVLSWIPLTDYYTPPLTSFLEGIPFFAVLVLCMFLYDFFSYWRHRLSHTNFLWPIHAPHHSSTQLNWLSGTREHFLDIFLICLLGNSLLYALGFPVEAILICAVIRLYWVNFVHMDMNFSLGPLDYVIVTPRFHRWHHVPDRNGNRNFSGFFSFIDLAFGTFYLPKDKVAEVFGVGTPNYPQSFSEQMAYPIVSYLKKKKSRKDKKTERNS